MIPFIYGFSVGMDVTTEIAADFIPHPLYMRDFDSLGVLIAQGGRSAETQHLVYS